MGTAGPCPQPGSGSRWLWAPPPLPPLHQAAGAPAPSAGFGVRGKQRGWQCVWGAGRFSPPEAAPGVRGWLRGSVPPGPRAGPPRSAPRSSRSCESCWTRTNNDNNNNNNNLKQAKRGSPASPPRTVPAGWRAPPGGRCRSARGRPGQPPPAAAGAGKRGAGGAVQGGSACAAPSLLPSFPLPCQPAAAFVGAARRYGILLGLQARALSPPPPPRWEAAAAAAEPAVTAALSGKEAGGARR